MKILIVLGSSSDKKIVDNGIEFLKKSKTPFSLRIASAHRSPDYLHSIVEEFDSKEGSVVICVAGKSAHLAGVVASLTRKPVIAVPVASDATAGFDSLLSMSQMPAGIPVATMGFGKSGFANACLLSLEILALTDSRVADFVKSERELMDKKVQSDDGANRVDFSG